MVWTLCSFVSFCELRVANDCQILHPRVHLNISRYAKVFVCHTKQQETWCFIFPIQKKHRPLINHANLIRLQRHFKKISYIILALGLLGIFRALPYDHGDVFLLSPPFIGRHTSLTEWVSNLKIYFLAFVLWAREIENANAGDANLELSGARALTEPRNIKIAGFW